MPKPEYAQKKANNQKPVFHRAEDIQLTWKNPLVTMDGPGEAQQPQAQDNGEAELNPLVDKELKRRNVELDRKQKQDQEDKTWVSNKMETMVKQADEAWKEEKKRLREAKNREDHSKYFLDRVQNARRESGKDMGMYKMVHIPSKTLLAKEFKGTFSDKISERKRAEKKLNKRSRLFQKIQNAENLNKAIASLHDTQNVEVSNLMMQQEMALGIEDMQDLAQFMEHGRGAKEANLELFQKYAGKRDRQAPGGVTGKNVLKALDIMAGSLFAININALNFETDADMVRNAPALESLAGRVAAFDRMAEKHGFLDSLESRERGILTEKLEALRSIAAYYNVRKEVIGDRYYQNHYNEELTMDFMEASNDEQRAVAEKLAQSYILGRNMMKINGVDISRILRRGEPQFKNADSQKVFDEMRREYVIGKKEKEISDRFYRQLGASFDEANKPETSRRISGVRQDMVDQAVANGFAYKGKERLLSQEEELPYNEDALKHMLRELKNIDVKQVKAGNYREMLQNYAVNEALCQQAEDIHYELTRGLMNGFKLSDKEAIEVRAKLAFFHSLRTTMYYVNNALLSDRDGFAGKTDAEWSAELQNTFQGGDRGDRLAFLPGNPEDFLRKYKEKFKAELASAEDSIRTVWRYIDPNDPPGPIPKEELKRRKKAYQKNAVISEFMRGQFDIQNGNAELNPVDGLIDAYCKQNGKERVDIGRTAISVMQGLPKDQVILLYEKIASGTPWEKFDFWKVALQEFKRVPYKDFNAMSITDWFDNFYQKQKVALIGSDLGLVVDSMKELYADKDLQRYIDNDGILRARLDHIGVADAQVIVEVSLEGGITEDAPYGVLHFHNTLAQDIPEESLANLLISLNGLNHVINAGAFPGFGCFCYYEPLSQVYLSYRMPVNLLEIEAEYDNIRYYLGATYEQMDLFVDFIMFAIASPDAMTISDYMDYLDEVSDLNDMEARLAAYEDKLEEIIRESGADEDDVHELSDEEIDAMELGEVELDEDAINA